MIPWAPKEFKAYNFVIIECLGLSEIQGYFKGSENKVMNVNLLYKETEKLRLQKIIVKSSIVTWPPLKTETHFSLQKITGKSVTHSGYAYVTQ